MQRSWSSGRSKRSDAKIAGWSARGTHGTQSVTLWRCGVRARCAARSSGFTAVPVIQGIAAVVKIAMLRGPAARSHGSGITTSALSLPNDSARMNENVRCGARRRGSAFSSATTVASWQPSATTTRRQRCIFRVPHTAHKSRTALCSITASRTVDCAVRR
eukprot:3055743-Rhodomonas_salina.1